MTPDLIHATAAIYSTRYTTEELLKLAQETKDDIDRKTLLIAVNVKNEAYGKQLTMELK